MGKQGKSFPPEFKQRMIALVRSGRSPESLSVSFDVSATAIRNWVAKADGDKQRVANGGLTNDERAELQRLRREVEDLREEREILKKATAWFARETNSTPPRRSGS